MNLEQSSLSRSFIEQNVWKKTIRVILGKSWQGKNIQDIEIDTE